jgi:methylenetetrahydrofolate--tRNA-(uracil-5-)-methyltransferase
LVSAEEKNFQPMNANFGILSPLDKVIKDKSLKKQEYSNRAINAIKEYKENNDVEF